MDSNYQPFLILFRNKEKCADFFHTMKKWESSFFKNHWYKQKISQTNVMIEIIDDLKTEYLLSDAYCYVPSLIFKVYH